MYLSIHTDFDLFLATNPAPALIDPGGGSEEDLEVCWDAGLKPMR